MPSIATNIVFVYVNSCMRLLPVESTVETYVTNTKVYLFALFVVQYFAQN